MSEASRSGPVSAPAPQRRLVARLVRGDFGFARTGLWFLLGGNVVLELVSRLMPDLTSKGWLLVVSAPAQALILLGLWRSAGALARPAPRRLAQAFVVLLWLVLILMTLGGIGLVSGL